MELCKKTVHMNRLKSHLTADLTLEDDFNVPDINDDIYKIITKDGQVNTDDINVVNGKVVITGHFNFRILYTSENGKKLHHMNGEIPFSESINIDDYNTTDSIDVKWDISDICVGIINTRKISVKSILSFSLSLEEIFDLQISTMPENNDDIICLEKNTSITMLSVNKKDIFRVKESLTLPSGKPNIGEIIWDNFSLKSVNSKVSNNSIIINGELCVFILYNAEDDGLPVQWLDSSIPFSGEIPVTGCTEDMIGDIDISINQTNISPRNDEDGELRIFEPDIVLDIAMKIYKDEECFFLSDAYSTRYNVLPTYNTVSYNTLIIKNLSKCRSVDKLKLSLGQSQILQILSSTGYAKIEDTEILDNGILVEGAVTVKIMFICSDDQNPVSIVDEVIPFSHTVEAASISEDSLCFIKPSLDVLSVVMTGSNAIEVKADILLDCLVLGNNSCDIVDDISLSDFSKDELGSRPGIVAYLPDKKETLWNISKKFHTTKERIIKLNDLNDGLNFWDIVPGDKLILID